jgi:hypothetical protein
LGVILLNIQSYAGGCDLWGKSKRTDSRFSPPSMSDGLFEVVGIKGTFHMAKIQTGGAKAKRIGQVPSSPDDCFEWRRMCFFLLFFLYFFSGSLYF